MTSQKVNPDKPHLTPKPRSIAAANGATTTPPSSQANAEEEDLLQAKSTDDN